MHIATRGSVGAQTPGMITVDATALPSCPKCTRVDAQGDVSRLRITSPRASFSDLVVDDVRVQVRNGPPRMVRWDILRLH